VLSITLSPLTVALTLTPADSFPHFNFSIYEMKMKQAEGEAAQIEIRARAHAKAIETVAAALQGPLGSEAAKLHVAREVFQLH
jgi:hypothetical protein